MKKYFAIDLGGTAIKYGVLDEDLQFSVHDKIQANTATKEDTYADIKKLYDAYGAGTEGVCISMPGMIDRKKGFAHTGGAYRWVKELPVANELSELLGCPVTICNDAKAAALAEIGFGHMHLVANGFLIILGTGIGGAIIVNGNLIDGTHFSSGEFSFIRGDVKDRTNRKDIFAMTNGVSGLKAAIKEVTGLEDIDGLKAFKMIKEEGNEEVLQGVKNFCADLAHHIYNLQAILDAERVLIGGGISNEPMFIDLVKEAVDDVFDKAWVPAIPKPEVMVCRFQADANLIGAVYNFIELQRLYDENSFMNV
ncbi:MAG: ROK family protein [Solobacterium sp.]|jgi:predicted NBD/HSP70 family sugar kinase|nr:ROK family protein [Solobacterium sp.]